MSGPPSPGPRADQPRPDPLPAAAGHPAADWRPVADWPTLRLRADLLRRLRQFFDARGFLEVETPLLSADVVVDRHLEPMAVAAALGPADTQSRWLQTSPEFAMKRLLAAGGQALYQVTKAFRREERGPRHNPEFTLVEWYRAGDDYRAGMDLLDHLAEALLERGPAERLSYREAFMRHAGLDPLSAPLDALRDAARQSGFLAEGPAVATDRDALCDAILVARVEPHLGRGRPTIVYDYPASQAALARVRPETPPVAERFELYVDSLELANGYHELLDAAALRQRAEENNRRRIEAGRVPLPVESRLLRAMAAGLPPSAGVALGFDRLVQVVAGKATLDEVLAFPFDRA